MTKYISDNGVRKFNPEWHPPPTAPVAPALPFQNQATALPIVSHPNGQQDFFDEEIVVAPSYQQALEQYNEIIVEAEAVPENSESPIDQLSTVLVRYEVPAGMLSKLLMLSEFELAEIIVDDSGSMNAQTDARGPQGQILTRWKEAKQRIEEMMEVIAYIPVAPVFYIRFLNRTQVLELQRNAGEPPQAFVERAKDALSQEFSKYPSGTTPALEAIRASFARYPPGGKAVPRYFFGDGVPNGGAHAAQQIAQLLVHRAEPSRNPFTFMSCTNNDEDVEWMKDCEEVAPYCSEFDDYEDESREIIKDQGKAFPYSYGLHLVGQIVAAFNPDDLDAMDESVPFTKQTLQDLMGYQVSPEEYKYYFDSFVEAQRRLPRQTHAQSSFVAKLPTLYHEFANASLARQIPAVAEYRTQMKESQQKAAARSTQIARSQQQPVQQECCAIL